MNKTRTGRGTLLPRLFGFLVGLMLAWAAPSYAGSIPATYQTYWGLAGCAYGCPEPPIPKTWFTPAAACLGYVAWKFPPQWYGVFVPAKNNLCEIYSPQGGYHVGSAVQPKGTVGTCPANASLDANGSTCSCRSGYQEDATRTICVAAAPQVFPVIVLEGLFSSTNYAPVGPELDHVAKVTLSGAPAAGHAVTVRFRDVIKTGTTDANGIYAFKYEPPFNTSGLASDVIQGTCGACMNTAARTITLRGEITTTAETCRVPAEVVYPSQISSSREVSDEGWLAPRTTFDFLESQRGSSRETGDEGWVEPNYSPTTQMGVVSYEAGNPIRVITGEKIQVETDFADGGVHPLPMVRRYRSLGQQGADAGLGAYWTHNWVGTASVSGTEAKIALAFDTTVFARNASGQWVVQSGLDTLTDVAGGGLQYERAKDHSRWTFDATGRLQAITLRNGWTYTLAYDAGGKLARVTNAFGRTIQFTYDGAGRLANVLLPNGSQAAYGFDAAGRVASASYTGGLGRGYLYADARFPQALTGYTDGSGQQLATFAYDDQGRAVSTEHAGGADRVTVSYSASPDSTGRATSIVTDAKGTQRTYTWQSGDGSVSLVGTSRPLNADSTANRTFGAGNLIDSEVDYLGVQTMHTWDVNRRLKLSTTQAANRPEARTTQVEWHPTMRLPLTITSSGLRTSHTYDAVGNRLSTTVTDLATGETRTWRWTYNAQNLLETATDSRGATWRYVHDSVGNVERITDPLGRVTRNTWDAAGRLQSRIEPAGIQTSYAYDALGRIIGVSRGGEGTSLTYTPTGLLAGATLPNGYQVNLHYDSARRLIGLTDNHGASVSYTLDAAGNRIREEVRDANGNIALTSSRVLDDLNRLTAVQGSLGQTTQIGYDANGVPVATTDPLNQTTRSTLDALQRPTATTFPDNASIGQTWNAQDQLTQVRDPKNVTTTYTYNAFGDVLTESSPDIGTIRYTRDTAGAVTHTQEAKGQIAKIERDLVGRILSIEYASDHRIDYRYDGAGYLSKVEDSSGSTELARDSLGRVTSRIQRVKDDPSNPSRFELGYSYANGDLTGVRYPSGLQVTYRRTAGRIVGIDLQIPGKAGSVPFISDLTHTALGQPKAWRWSNGAQASRTFDADGRMTANELASYRFDAAGRITGITQQLWATRSGTHFQVPVTWSASYDSRNRLIAFARSGAESRYGYDANGNRLWATEKFAGAVDLDGVLEGENRGQITEQTLNIEATSNRLLGLTQTTTTTQNGKTSSVVTTPVSYGIDANGSTTSDGLRSFEYDAAGRVAKVRIVKNGEAVGIRYLYNAAGQRVFKGEPEVEQTLPSEKELGQSFIAWLKNNFGWMFTPRKNGQTTLGQAFVYGSGPLPGWAMLGEYDNGSASGKGTSEYIWLPTGGASAIPVGILRNGKLYAIHTDHLGTPRMMTDEGNQPVWQWAYSSFGQNEPIGWLTGRSSDRDAASLKATKPQEEFNLRFPGQYRDVEANTNYNIFRDFDPVTDRYRQADKIGLLGGPNLFIYVGGDPLNFSDPYGLLKVILLQPGTPEYRHAQRVPDNPNGIIVFGHGDYQGNVLAPNGSPMSSADLARAIFDAGGKAGMPIELRVCGAGGSGENSAARRLSAYVPGSVVSGPRSSITADGTTWSPAWMGNWAPWPSGRSGMIFYLGGQQQ